MRRLLTSLLLAAALLLFASPLQAAGPLPSISGQSAALFDLQTGRILAGIDQDARIFPASTTKVLTALLVLEQSDLEDTVTISTRAQSQEGTSLYTRAGEQYRMGDLLTAMLVQSCNDAAVALAEHVAGTVEAFAEQMNQRAVELGATGTNFVNPNGLHDENHYSTAADMALIFVAAMRNPIIRELSGTRIARVTIGSGEERLLVNGNEMIQRYDGTIGGKTGYTSQSGQSILTAANRQGMEIGVVVFKCQGKAVWTDATNLLDYGFSNWQKTSVVVANQSVTALPVRYGSTALLVADEEISFVAPAADKEPILQQVELDKPLQAPLGAGDIVGVVRYFQGEREVASVSLKVATAVPRAWFTYWQVPLTLFVGYIGFSIHHRVKSVPKLQEEKLSIVRKG